MNEFQMRSLFENRFGGTPESFGLSVESDENGSFFSANGHALRLRVVNGQQAGWLLGDREICATPPNRAVLKKNDADRVANGVALREALI